MATVAGVSAVVAEHRYAQQEITHAFASAATASERQRALVERIHAATGVGHRYLALPLDEYARLDGFTAANDAFIRVGTDLGERAVSEALAAAGLTAAD